MENYPMDLIKQITSLTLGNTIRFKRDSDGRVNEIIGETDDKNISQIDFNYETDRISIHAVCLNEEGYSPVDIVICDIHIHLPIKNCWSYTIDLTEVEKKGKTLNRYHSSRKTYLNKEGRIEKIVDGVLPLYLGHYNNDGLLLREYCNGVDIHYGYNTYGSVEWKKSYKKKCLIEHWSYEYSDESVGPIREFLITASG